MGMRKLDLNDQPIARGLNIVTRAMVHGLPELDVLLAFAKPSVVPAGLVCLHRRVEIYHTLDGTLKVSYAERSDTHTPSASVSELLRRLGIERGSAADGKGLEGKIVDLTEPSSAVNLHDIYPNLQVSANETLFDYNDVLRFVVKRYPGDKWMV